MIATPPRARARLLVVLSIALVVAALGAGLRHAFTAPAVPADPAVASALPDRPLSPIEQKAVARFAGLAPAVRLPDGRRVPPSNAEHALAIEVNLFKGLLARDLEQRDPSFRRRAEAELARRRPLHAGIAWEDPSGNRELSFSVDDSEACGLAPGAEVLVLDEREITAYPCLDRDNLWDPGTPLSVHLEPVDPAEPLWQELLRDTLKQRAADAYLAQLTADPEA